MTGMADVNYHSQRRQQVTEKRDGRTAVQVIIAAHKAYRMPEDSLYLPLQVGAEGRESIGYRRDDEGENISRLNPSFCELTGLYWAWKNLEADYLGLVHYRRHFSFDPKTKEPWEHILTAKELEPFLPKIRLFVPGRRNYYIETLYSHYSHTHYASQLDETREILREGDPDIVFLFDAVLKQRGGYMFNMLIAERRLFDDYCAWVFDVLFELKNRIGREAEEQLDAFQGRLYGRVSEILFNVWLEKQLRDGTLKREEIMEIPVLHMEKVDWKKKGTAFLKAKMIGKRYERSF